MCKDFFDIVGDSGGQWDIVVGVASLYQHLEPRVLHNAEWAHAFCDLSHNLSMHLGMGMGVVSVGDHTLFALKVSCDCPHHEDQLHNALVHFLMVDNCEHGLHHVFLPALLHVLLEVRC